MKIKPVNCVDIPAWRALSSEYDGYVSALTPDLAEWYQGNESEPAFDDYMEAKIDQGKAFMAADAKENCLGIVAFSKKHNRITFFGISHRSDFRAVGGALLEYVRSLLDPSKAIRINEIASDASWIQCHGALYAEMGFVCEGQDRENGVPVRVFVRKPSQS